MRATGSPARTVSPWDTVTSRTWTYATWTSVGSPSTSCWNRMALERPEPRTPGSVDSGLIWKPRTTASKGASSGSRQLCQSSLRVPSPVYSDSQVAVRSAVPPHHDAVGAERVGYVVLRAERVFGALERCGDGRVDRDRLDRVGGRAKMVPARCSQLRGGWRGRRAQGQRHEDGRAGDGVECVPDHRFQ